MPATPLRRQYLQVKRRFPDAIVLFRLGDFYETFDEDARLAAGILGITLTSRELGKGQRHPMAGIPYHALDNYLGKLLQQGHKVAICEQLTEPGQGLMERDVVRVVTPGTVVEPNLLEQKANNYLAALVAEGEQVGLAYVDITTGEFATAQLEASEVPAEVGRLRPAEFLVPKGQQMAQAWLTAPVSRLDDAWFGAEACRELLLAHFQATTLEAYGCEGLPQAVRAAGAILRYLEETQKAALAQLTRLSTYSTHRFMVLDAQTRRNLELFQDSRPGAPAHSLLSVLDITRTPMGGRLLRRWLGQPLLDLPELTRRQDAVDQFVGQDMLRQECTTMLGHMSDLERLVNRIRGGIALPRDLVALRRSLELVPRLRDALQESPRASSLGWLLAELRPCQEVAQLIASAILDEPSASAGEGNVIAQGFSPEVDELRQASRNAKEYLAGLERKERERTGIRSLKVGFNRVFGYYLEVSKASLKQVPQDYIRKQTLTDAERFFTPELKEYESLILNAQERIQELESSLYRQVCAQVGGYAEPLLALASALAHLDVFTALAEVSARFNYVRPTLNEGHAIEIKDGRHPVVERSLEMGTFVPNDTHLSNEAEQIVVLTGPNMAGKSTYLRQVALIVLMAQIGSFVPAASATLGLADRIFTRVGLQDDLATGRSTFMVEMLETAGILHQATPRSLIILDEIGRGTSTYDGLSIARAVVEYLHNHPRLGCKTLFATHYHELVDLAQVLPRVRNYNVAVVEEKGKVIFLHSIVPGGADKSYGIHVAQLAGLPRPVVRRAQEILLELEADGGRPTLATPQGQRTRDKRRRLALSAELSPTEATRAVQLSFLPRQSPVLEDLLGLDIATMTPLEAITKLYELQQKARERR